MIRSLTALILLIAGTSSAQELRISGSSTAAPLIADAMLEEALDGVDLDPTGTLEGFRELCDERSAGVIGASRKINEMEIDLCARNGMGDLLEIPIGMDGLVVATGRRMRGFQVDLLELYLAAAAQIPLDETCVLVPNPNTSWRDVDPSNPNRPIRIFGPPASSATRGIFIDRALARGARQIDCLEELERQDPAAFERAIMPRHDRVWLDAGENDEAIAFALSRVDDAVGIFGWRAFQGQPGLHALPIAGVAPNERSILDRSYPLSRPLFVYASPEAMREPSVRRLVKRLGASEEAARVRVYGTPGPDGEPQPISKVTEKKRIYGGQNR
ncbi:hypothetical protein HK107_10080 [Parvularcula sp. ZS-1/3]|uniref:PBP domain-containing protein n=1 Tax=Parvularcula mediterranea TaxID=2732508 RepID=A0A7Y3RM74_9PROT|nr:substrate-binding domain-containing protein [Parvularcula mediterranea]NNU16668.1 hypothetical protein [Parvularcula mediterranea]